MDKHCTLHGSPMQPIGADNICWRCRYEKIKEQLERALELPLAIANPKDFKNYVNLKTEARLMPYLEGMTDADIKTRCKRIVQLDNPNYICFQLDGIVILEISTVDGRVFFKEHGTPPPLKVLPKKK